MPAACANDDGVGRFGGTRRRLDGERWVEGGNGKGGFVGGLQEFGISGGVGMRHVGSGRNGGLERIPQRGRPLWSSRRDRSHEGGHDSHKHSRPVVIEHNHIPSIGGCGWKRSPPRNGYRGGGAGIRVESGGTDADRCVPLYYNDVHSGGGLGPGGVAGYRDSRSSRNPSSRYAADVQQRSPLAHVVACESWNQHILRPSSQDRGVGQWPGNTTHGRSPGGWNLSDPPNRISQREDSRIAPPRSSGSNGSGGAINTFGRVRNSTLNRVNILASPINRHQNPLNGLSRNRFRRSDRSRTHSRERSGGVGGCLDYSDKTNRYGADRRSRVDLRIPLRSRPPVGIPRYRGRSPGRARREYADGKDSSGGCTRQDADMPQTFAGEFQTGSGKESRYVNGESNEVSPECVFQRGRRLWSPRRCCNLEGGNDWELSSRSVMVKPSHITFIGDRGWKRSPPRNGYYRGGGANVGVRPGETEVDRCVPLYYNGVHSGGGLGPGGVAGYRDSRSSRNPSSRYAADVQQRSPLAHVVACESWNQHILRPSSQDRGVEQWPGNTTHGRSPGGWNLSDPPNRISQREDSRIYPPRSSGSNGSGGAINTFGRVRNNTLNRVNMLASPINRHQNPLNGLSRNRFRRSDRSRTHSRERSGGVGGCLDYSDKTNRYGADCRSRVDLRIPLRSRPPVGRPRYRGRSPGRARREYADGEDSGGGCTRQDADMPQTFVGEFQTGSGKESRYVNGESNEVSPEYVFQRGRRLWSPRRCCNLEDGNDWLPSSRSVMVNPSHITFIGDRGWKRSPSRDGYYRGGGADVGVRPGETEVDRCVPLYYNDVHSGGGLGPGGVAGYRDSRRSRNPSRRYAADVQRKSPLAHVVACESWNQHILRPSSQDRGVEQWPGNTTHGRSPGGWNLSDPPNRISQREDSRIAPPRSSGSNGSGGAINTFGRVRNSTLNRVNILASPINRHQNPLNGLSRNRFRRSDRSRTHSRERSGGVGGCLDYSDKTNRYGADRRSRVDLHIPLRSRPPVGHPRYRGRSPGRARREYADGKDGGGGCTRQDADMPQTFAGEFQTGSGKESRYVNGESNEVSPECVFQRGRRLWSPRRCCNLEGGNDWELSSRSVMVKPSHITFIGDRGWKRSPPRNGYYRGGGADVGVRPGETEVDRCVPLYYNGVHSGGGLGPGGVAGYRDSRSRNPSSRYAADVQQRSPLAHVVACESWNQHILRPSSQDRGVEQWPGNTTHGRSPGGWNPSDPPNRISQREDSRIAPPRSSGSNGSGGAINTFGRVRNSTLNRVNILASPINRHQNPLNDLSRNRFRRSDRSRTHSRERSGGVGGCLDYSDKTNRYGADCRSRVDLRIPLRSRPPVGRPRYRGRSPGRARREYADGEDSGGGCTRQDADMPQTFVGEFQTGSGKESRYVNGESNEVSPEYVFQRGRRLWSPRRCCNLEDGNDWLPSSRSVMVNPSHITFIGDRGWKRSPPRDGYYRGGGADVGVRPGETEVDRCVPLYYNDVHSGGGLGPGGVAGYRDSRRSRNPSRRYAVDVQRKSPLAHVVACESWNQHILRPSSQDRGVEQWPGNTTHGRSPGGWNPNDPPNRISRREDSRIAPPRSSGSNGSGGAINTFGRVRNSTLNRVNILASPINRHQNPLNGLSRNRFRRSDRSRTHSRERSGGVGGCLDYSDKTNRYGADRRSRVDLRIPLRSRPPVGRPRYRGRSPGRTRREYADGKDSGGGCTRQDADMPQTFVGGFQTGSGKESRYVNGESNEVSPEYVFQRGMRLWSPRRCCNLEGGNDWELSSRSVMVKPSHITFIGDRGWKRVPPRDGYYRGGDADVGVEPGETEVDRCVPLYYNDVHSGGWLGSNRGAGYKDDSRNRTPSSRYAADVEQGLSLAHVGACESWDQPIACPPGQDPGIGQWPGNISHGRPSGGWNHVDPFYKIYQETYPRNAPSRFSGSNLSGRANNALGGITNSTLNVGNFPFSPIDERLYHPHDPSRIRFRSSDGSRTYIEERFGGSGGYRDNSNNMNRDGADRVSGADVRRPLQSPPPVWRQRSRGHSPGWARRGYAGGMDGGGSAPRQDDVICQRHAGESLDGSVKESCYVNGKEDGVGPERAFQRGQRRWSPRRDWNVEASHDSHKNARAVVKAFSHIPSIGDRGWKRSGPRKGYRDVSADIGVGPGRTEIDRCIRYSSNGVHSGGWLGPDRGAGYKDDSRNRTPSSRYAADAEQGPSLVHVRACESWDQPVVCLPRQDHGFGQWSGSISHGRPSGGWNHVDPLYKIYQEKYPRNAPPRFSGSHLSGRVTNAFGGIKNSTLNVGNFPFSPIHERLYHPHGSSRIRFRRSDRSRTHSKERFGGSGGYRDNSDNMNRNDADRASGVDVRTSLRNLSPVWRLPSHGCSPGRVRRGYAGGMDGGGGAPGPDYFFPQKFTGDVRNGITTEGRYENCGSRGYATGGGVYAKYAVGSHRHDGLRNVSRLGDWVPLRRGGEVGRREGSEGPNGRPPSWRRGDYAASDGRNGGRNSSGSGDDQEHFKVRALQLMTLRSFSEGGRKGFVVKRGTVSHHRTIRRSSPSPSYLLFLYPTSTLLFFC